jgi:hypothetical protein
MTLQQQSLPSILPGAPSLEYYRKQAKALLRSIQSADETALARVRQHLPRFHPDSIFKLSDAQWILAREHGFASWASFKRHLEEREAAIAAVQPTETIQENSMNHTVTPVYEPSMKSEAVFAKTGKTWDEWFSLLDEAGCSNKTHKEIVAVVHENGAGSWWQQMVTVEYERARGLRVKFESCDGDIRVNASKTIAAPVEAVFYAWADPEKRELWLTGSGLTIRKSTCPKSVRITWADGTNVDVVITPKTGGKCTCAVEHAKLGSIEQVEPRKAFWAAAMGRLKELVEA